MLEIAALATDENLLLFSFADSLAIISNKKNMKTCLEGKCMGYEKKYLAIAIAILAALVIFYAGTRYEKMRINSGKGGSTTSATKKVKAPKPAATASGEVTPTPVETTSPTTAPAAPKAVTVPVK